MNEKKRKICDTCDSIVIATIICYIVTILLGTDRYLYMLRILFSSIATVANCITFGIELTSNENAEETASMILVSAFFLFISISELLL